MVQAVRVHAFGGPEVMKVEDVTLPAPGPGEVLVRLHAAGVNYIDTYFRTGAYKVPALPFILGNEGAGEVVALGDGVGGLRKGDRVAFVDTLGCYAGARVVPVHRLIKLPESIAFETAAAMMLKGLTAQYLLRQTYAVVPGDTILVQAAAGGVGLILCQWGKLLGATVIGTAGSQEKADRARAAGADHVILYRQDDVPTRVRELTGGNMCHVVYDGVGRSTFPASLDCLRPLGTFVSFGSASGRIDAFDINILAAKGSLFATRPTLNTFTADPAKLQGMADELMKVVGNGDVRIAVDKRAPLASAADMHRALEGRETMGSSVLLI